jgi:ribosomal protein L11 methyltransferase
LGDRKLWPALLLQSGASSDSTLAELVSATLDDFSPIAIQDLTDVPVPPAGLWDPTAAPLPEPPPSPLNWRVFFASSRHRDVAAAALKALHPSVTVEVENVADDDWAARSQREVTAIRAGSFIVAPPWNVPAPAHDGSVLIVIEPSRGFGTGHHASTRLCLRALSDVDVRDARVLDIGTGSGVLAMAAALKGAREVLAVDVDPDAIEAARHSAALNQHVEQVDWQVADFRDEQWPAIARDWDVVLANLTGGMLIASADRLRALVGVRILIVSGFDKDERVEVERALHMKTSASFIEDGWVGLVLTCG